jgi:hypothetical protein
MALIPASLLWLRLPDLVALLTFLPLYGVALQLIANLIGVGLFGRCYGTPVPLRVKLAMPFTFLPYQWMIGVSALRAVVRHLLQHGSGRRPNTMAPIATSKRCRHPRWSVPQRGRSARAREFVSVVYG